MADPDRILDDYDSPWKEALEQYFPAFCAFYFLLAYAGIAWERGYEWLDKELQQVVRDAEVGRRYADKLIKVWRRDGVETWMLVHVEVQGQYEAGFAERMFQYYSRLSDRYRRPVASLVVLTDQRPNWRPSRYRQALWGCELRLRYPVVKLLDYRGRDAELEAHPNPFALVTLAHLKAQDTAHDPTTRYQWKRRLVQGLYERGWERQDVLELFRFLDWMLRLPDADEDRLWVELQQFEEQRVMQYVTSVERIGIKKGLQQGLQQGEGRILRRLLARKFGSIPDWVETRLAAATPDQLENWSERVLDAATLGAVFADA
jgi:hypothetical protein